MQHKFGGHIVNIKTKLEIYKNGGNTILQMLKQYKLLNSNGETYLSDTPGTLGGHRRLKIYGRLDCPSALRHIKNGHYVKHRVFFADEATAIAAGYRPCAVCMPEEYKMWKEKNT